MRLFMKNHSNTVYIVVLLYIGNWNRVKSNTIYNILQHKLSSYVQTKNKVILNKKQVGLLLELKFVLGLP